jgi:hypothetical protein
MTTGSKAPPLPPPPRLHGFGSGSDYWTSQDPAPLAPTSWTPARLEPEFGATLFS